MRSAELAFGDNHELIPDRRLRECDYEEMNQERKNWNLKNYIENPYPGGESYKEVEERVRDFLESAEDEREDNKIRIISHQAPQLAIEV